MKRFNFTAERVSEFKCQQGNQQTIYWDGKSPGLGLRVTKTEHKSYIFETKLHGKTLRMTIGNPRTWPLGKAREEAARLKVMTDQGIDPRLVDKERKAAQEAAIEAIRAKEIRETVTVGNAWEEYIKTMSFNWGTLHLHDHMRAMKIGGELRSHSKRLTEPGTLISLAQLRLVDLTEERLISWAKFEGAKRPARARNARTLLSTFLNWCIAHPVYKSIVKSNPAQSKEVKKYLGKASVKNDSLQREQLPAWFNAVKKINNLVISAYLQALLITGARPNELITIKWQDIDFKWKSITIKDKIEGLRIIPLSPYIAQLLEMLPRHNEWVFSSLTSASGHLIEARTAHVKACKVAGLEITLHGLRRSFASLCWWVGMPEGISAQIQGHKPSGVREKHYIRRPLDMLREWHVKIEAWILEQAGIEFEPNKPILRAITAT